MESSAPALLYGAFGQLLMDGETMRRGWVVDPVLENRRGKAGGVQCICVADVTRDGVKDLLVGRDDGTADGVAVDGRGVGAGTGMSVDAEVGTREGMSDGASEGYAMGLGDGRRDGDEDGFNEGGDELGEEDGAAVDGRAVDAGRDRRPPPAVLAQRVRAVSQQYTHTVGGRAPRRRALRHDRQGQGVPGVAGRGRGGAAAAASGGDSG